jgi:uncharacterized protein YifN (PemK superfamily)
MPIQFPPNLGQILICDYQTGFQPPEMVKVRPVVVVSPRTRIATRLCVVVPLSTTQPDSPQEYHYQLKLARPLPEPFSAEEMWVKADLVAAVGFQRLSMPCSSRGRDGQRKYFKVLIDAEQLEAVQACVKKIFGFN